MDFWPPMELIDGINRINGAWDIDGIWINIFQGYC